MFAKKGECKGEDEMKKHRYADSILNTEPGTCYLCGRRVPDTALHHIYGGRNRRISSENGFYVFLCPECHFSLHNNAQSLTGEYLKSVCEGIYEDRHSREDFFSLIGRYYI